MLLRKKSSPWFASCHFKCIRQNRIGFAAWWSNRHTWTSLVLIRSTIAPTLRLEVLNTRTRWTPSSLSSSSSSVTTRCFIRLPPIASRSSKILKKQIWWLASCRSYRQAIRARASRVAHIMWILWIIRIKLICSSLTSISTIWLPITTRKTLPSSRQVWILLKKHSELMPLLREQSSLESTSLGLRHHLWRLTSIYFPKSLISIKKAIGRWICPRSSTSLTKTTMKTVIEISTLSNQTYSFWLFNEMVVMLW